MFFGNLRSIEFVKTYLVDFVNAESDEDRYQTFNNIIEKGIEFLTNKKPVFSEKINPKTDKKAIAHIQNIILKILRIALIDGEFKKLYPEADNGDLKETELEKYIHDLYSGQNHSEFFRWRGKGESFKYLDWFKDESVFTKCEYIIIINVLLELFKSDDWYFIEYGNGYEYFSFCPKCGKFFYKQRKDQVYCSERCRKNDKSMRYRKKLKDGT